MMGVRAWLCMCIMKKRKGVFSSRHLYVSRERVSTVQKTEKYPMCSVNMCASQKREREREKGKEKKRREIITRTNSYPQS
jgi:hypothetical protein